MPERPPDRPEYALENSARFLQPSAEPIRGAVLAVAFNLGQQPGSACSIGAGTAVGVVHQVPDAQWAIRPQMVPYVGVLWTWWHIMA